MKADDQIRDEKLQQDIKREAAKTSALSSGIIDKYQYLEGEEILPPDESRLIEQAKFSYFPLGTAFAKKKLKQLKIKEKNKLKLSAEYEQKTKSVGGIFPKDLENNDIKYELSKIKKQKKKLTEMI